MLLSGHTHVGEVRCERSTVCISSGTKSVQLTLQLAPRTAVTNNDNMLPFALRLAPKWVLFPGGDDCGAVGGQIFHADVPKPVFSKRFLQFRDPAGLLDEAGQAIEDLAPGR